MVSYGKLYGTKPYFLCQTILKVGQLFLLLFYPNYMIMVIKVQEPWLPKQLGPSKRLCETKQKHNSVFNTRLWSTDPGSTAVAVWSWQSYLTLQCFVPLFLKVWVSIFSGIRIFKVIRFCRNENLKQYVSSV